MRVWLDHFYIISQIGHHFSYLITKCDAALGSTESSADLKTNGIEVTETNPNQHSHLILEKGAKNMLMKK